ncbi:DNA (cytosine-5-)-methyltransferase, partial [Salmonella enterica]|uniref:DNA (cytosine-5-)-methyltransferase n=1 Tax=Salmonella enterica TaxID=28901 RepID=UPI0020D093C1
QAMKEIGLSTKCVKSSEIDKKACESYKLNFDEESYCDIHDVDIDESFDVLLAGFPCQAFSYAGKQLGFADTRGTLFFEVERIIKKNKPKLCLLENVRGLTSHDKGRTFSTILKSLHNYGYHVEY